MNAQVISPSHLVLTTSLNLKSSSNVSRNGVRIPQKLSYAYIPPSCRPQPCTNRNISSRPFFHCSTAGGRHSGQSAGVGAPPAKVASILSIGTANPDNIVYQDDYPNYYFRVTKSEHLTNLKDKFKRACDKSMIRKRHMVLNEEILKDNPNMCEYVAPSLDARQKVVVPEVPRLASEAAAKAIEEWGQPKSKITHVVFGTSSVVDMPGADYQLSKLLGLRPSVNRFMLCQQGCFAGGTVLRLAKDLAENNKDARVLVVSSEVTVPNFRGPSEANFGNTVGQALFADGAAAVIVGSNPDPAVERPLFQLVSAGQTFVPGTEGHMHGHFGEDGLNFKMSKDIPDIISSNIGEILKRAFSPLGISDWNSLFWISHPGGRAIVDQLELKLGLDKEKLRTTRHVLSEYGNMSSACVLFTLDEMRRRSAAEGKATTGDGLEWGVLLGFGPGITVETIVLHSLPIPN